MGAITNLLLVICTVNIFHYGIVSGGVLRIPEKPLNSNFRHTLKYHNVDTIEGVGTDVGNVPPSETPLGKISPSTHLKPDSPITANQQSSQVPQSISNLILSPNPATNLETSNVLSSIVQQSHPAAAMQEFHASKPSHLSEVSYPTLSHTGTDSSDLVPVPILLPAELPESVSTAYEVNPIATLLEFHSEPPTGPELTDSTTQDVFSFSFEPQQLPFPANLQSVSITESSPVLANLPQPVPNQDGPNPIASLLENHNEPPAIIVSYSIPAVSVDEQLTNPFSVLQTFPDPLHFESVVPVPTQLSSVSVSTDEANSVVPLPQSFYPSASLASDSFGLGILSEPVPNILESTVSQLPPPVTSAEEPNPIATLLESTIFSVLEPSEANNAPPLSQIETLSNPVPSGFEEAPVLSQLPPSSAVSNAEEPNPIAVLLESNNLPALQLSEESNAILPQNIETLSNPDPIISFEPAAPEVAAVPEIILQPSPAAEDSPNSNQPEALNEIIPAVLESAGNSEPTFQVQLPMNPSAAFQELTNPVSSFSQLSNPVSAFQNIPLQGASLQDTVNVLTALQQPDSLNILQTPAEGEEGTLGVGGGWSPSLQPDSGVQTLLMDTYLSMGSAAAVSSNHSEQLELVGSHDNPAVAELVFGSASDYLLYGTTLQETSGSDHGTQHSLGHIDGGSSQMYEVAVMGDKNDITVEGSSDAIGIGSIVQESLSDTLLSSGVSEEDTSSQENVIEPQLEEPTPENSELPSTTLIETIPPEKTEDDSSSLPMDESSNLTLDLDQETEGDIINEPNPEENGLNLAILE